MSSLAAVELDALAALFAAIIFNAQSHPPKKMASLKVQSQAKPPITLVLFDMDGYVETLGLLLTISTLRPFVLSSLLLVKALRDSIYKEGP